MPNALRHRYLPGTVIQYRDGHVRIKTEDGLRPLSRVVAATSEKVLGGGQELQKGWRVVHLDMSTFGTKQHDDPSNLAVIKCRTTKFEFLKSSKILFEPKPGQKPIKILERAI